MSANNKEAQSGINRFIAHKSREAGVLETNPNLRPKYVQKEKSLAQADKWRTLILGEISSKLTKINDTALNDYQIRDLNDDLNKLFKEKRAWEYHIRDLNGPDYLRLQSQLSLGMQVNGYRYYGRAKELPDVTVILDERRRQAAQTNDRQAQLDREAQKLIMRHEGLDCEYYGFDIAGGTLKAKVKAQAADLMPEEGLLHKLTSVVVEEELDDPFDERFIPTNEMVHNWLVERRRRQLLAQLAHS